jgi:hypothetical protein
MDSERWKLEQFVGDSESPLASSLCLNEFTVLSLTRVRGAYPDFRIPPTYGLIGTWKVGRGPVGKGKGGR